MRTTNYYKPLCRVADLLGGDRIELPDGLSYDTETVFAIHRRSCGYLPTVDAGDGQYEAYLPIAAVLKGARLIVLSYYSAYGHVRAPLNLNPETQVYYLAERRHALPRPEVKAVNNLEV